MTSLVFDNLFDFMWRSIRWRQGLCWASILFDRVPLLSDVRLQLLPLSGAIAGAATTASAASTMKCVVAEIVERARLRRVAGPVLEGEAERDAGFVQGFVERVGHGRHAGHIREREPLSGSLWMRAI